MFTVPKGSLAVLRLGESFAWILREGREHLAFFLAPTPRPYPESLPYDLYSNYNSVHRGKKPQKYLPDCAKKGYSN